MQLNFNGPSLYGVMAFAETENARPRFVWAANLDQRREIEALLRLRTANLSGTSAVGWRGSRCRRSRLSCSAAAFDSTQRSPRTRHGRSARFAVCLRLRGPEPVCQIADGQVVAYPSTAEAARRNGVTRARIFRLFGALCVTRHGLWI